MSMKTIKCINCDKPIILVENSIDDVWVHVNDGLAMCNGENFMLAKNWAEPNKEAIHGTQTASRDRKSENLSSTRLE